MRNNSAIRQYIYIFYCLLIFSSCLPARTNNHATFKIKNIGTQELQVINDVLGEWNRDDFDVYHYTVLGDDPFANKQNFRIKFDKKTIKIFPNLHETTIENFINSNRITHELNQHLFIDSPFKINVVNKYTDEAFGISRVGFNSENNQAIIFIQNRHIGCYYLFDLIENQWKYQGRLVSWMH